MSLQFDSDLLAQLYATAEDDARWMPVLDRLCRGLNASSAVVQLLEEGSEGIDAVWVARDSRSSANSLEHDRWVNNADNPRLGKPLPMKPGIGAVVGSDSRLFAEDPATLSLIRNRIAKAGLGQAFWASFALSSRQRFSLILHRNGGDYSDLTAAEEATLGQLLPHLEQSVRLASALRVKQSRIDVLQESLEHIEIGMLLSDATLAVPWANSVAIDLIERSSALVFDRGFLVARSPSDRKRLLALVEAAEAGMAGSLVDTFDQNGDFPLHLRAVGSYGRQGKRIVSLYISGPAHLVSPDPSEIGRLFNLTPAESRLTAALGAGHTLAQYASDAGITVGTARNQLKQVLGKTNTDRQADLVRILSRSIVGRTRASLP